MCGRAVDDLNPGGAEEDASTELGSIREVMSEESEEASEGSDMDDMEDNDSDEIDEGVNDESVDMEEEDLDRESELLRLLHSLPPSRPPSAKFSYLEN